MKIEITVSDATARTWRHYLRRKQSSKAELPRLIIMEMWTIVGEEADKELKELKELKESEAKP